MRLTEDVIIDLEKLPYYVQQEIVDMLNSNYTNQEEIFSYDWAKNDNRI